jgi:hypothetical protein
MLSIHSYSSNLNLGDSIQSIALSRLLTEPFVYEDRNQFKSKDKTYVCNGWLNEEWISYNQSQDHQKYIFAGVYCADETSFNELLSIAQYYKLIVGCRDPYTYNKFINEEVKVELIGCATLTLPRYYGPRKGTIWVDCNEDANGFKDALPYFEVSHKRQETSWELELSVANNLLFKYARAEHVITSRLHCFYPCLAFGTPVTLFYDENDPRFSLVKSWGIQSGMKVYSNTVIDEYGTVKDMVEEYANKYISFLKSQGVNIIY